MSTKPVPDWERIEQQYRAGVMSLREIAKSSSGAVSEGAIRKRAKRDGWDRDIGAKVRARAEALVRKEAVRSEVRSGSQYAERDAIEANAKAIADIRLAHRGDIRSGRSLVQKLFAEVTAVTDRPELIEELETALVPVEDEDSEQAKVRRRKLQEAMDRVLSLPSRVGSAKALSEALKNLIALERQAWSIGDEAEEDAVAKRRKAPLSEWSDEELAAQEAELAVMRKRLELARATA